MELVGKAKVPPLPSPPQTKWKVGWSAACFLDFPMPDKCASSASREARHHPTHKALSYNSATTAAVWVSSPTASPEPRGRGTPFCLCHTRIINSMTDKCLGLIGHPGFGGRYYSKVASSNKQGLERSIEAGGFPPQESTCHALLSRARNTQGSLPPSLRGF